jgi:hypothetical protein
MASDVRQSARWAVDLVCCGHDGGTVVRNSWQEADDFREAYCDAGGHERVGIVRRAEIGEQDHPVGPGFRGRRF